MKEYVTGNNTLYASIYNFLKSLEQPPETLRIEGEIPDVSYYLKRYRDLQRIYVTPPITEGLIKTYPLEKTLNYIATKYNLTPDQIFTEPLDNGITITHLICVILPNSFDKNAIGEIKHDMQTCGYFFNKDIHPIKGSGYSLITFEPKYTLDITELVREKYHYLYHSTPCLYVEKIMKNGLIPKSKSHLFLYPDRTFLMLGDELDNKQIRTIKNIQTLRNANINPKNRAETKQYALLTLDVSKLPQDIQFYSDPQADYAIFTNDNIPPTAITNIEPFTL